MSSIPKAVLYYSQDSVWSSVVLLALDEKGYGDDEYDLKIVDLAKGENFDPTFLRLNRKATVPTLVVPLENSLSGEVESRYKALNQSRAIVDLLDKSRSSLSRTHTTSQAPAMALAPATVAFSTTTNSLLDLIHSDEANPNNFLYLNATDDASLKILAAKMTPYLTTRRDALDRYLGDDSLNVSEKVKTFWREKKDATELLLELYSDGQTATSELPAAVQAKRAELFATSQSARETMKDILVKISTEIIGPYTLGDQFSIVDLHLAAWLTRILSYADVDAKDDGDVATEKLSKYVGGVFTPEQTTKVGAYWEAIKERPSWKKVYASGLH